jgi:Mrp family chromosome partitioning ATPase
MTTSATAAPGASMSDSTARAAEQMMLVLRQADVRTIAFASVEPGSGASAFAARTASVLARAGQPTLLIDISRTTQSSNGETSWIPGQGEAKVTPANTQADYARLTVHTEAEVRFLFGNVDWFRKVLDADLSSYAYIVLDLAPLSDRAEDTVNPLAAAAACDALAIVLQRGSVTRSKLRQTVDMARTAGSNPVGIVMTQGGYVSAGEEIARAVRRLFFFAPWIGKRLGRRIRASEILG